MERKELDRIISKYGDKLIYPHKSFTPAKDIKSLIKEFRTKNASLILGPLEWHKAKKWKTSDELMPLYNKFRKLVIDSMVYSIIESILAKKEQLQTKHRNMIAMAYGTAKVTSDYDVVISGIYSDHVIKEFFKDFKKYFGQSSDIVFDTNIVADEFFRPLCCIPFYKTITYNDQQDKMQILQVRDVKDRNRQHAWALNKILEGFDQLVSDKLLSKAEQDVFIDALNVKKASNHVSVIIKEAHKIFKENYKLKSSKKRSEILTAEVFKVFQIQRSIIHGEIPLSKKKKTLMNLKDRITLTNYLSEEMLYSQGAVFHVAKIMQLKESTLPITKHQLLDSVIENIGEIMHCISKNRKEPMYKLIVDMSKYFERAYDAMMRIGFEFTDRQLFWYYFNNIVNLQIRRKVTKQSEITKKLKNYFADLHVDFNQTHLPISELTSSTPVDHAIVLNILTELFALLKAQMNQVQW